MVRVLEQKLLQAILMCQKRRKDGRDEYNRVVGVIYKEITGSNENI